MTELERSLAQFMDQKTEPKIENGRLTIQFVDPVRLPFTGRPEPRLNGVAIDARGGDTRPSARRWSTSSPNVGVVGSASVTATLPLRPAPKPLVTFGAGCEGLTIEIHTRIDRLDSERLATKIVDGLRQLADPGRLRLTSGESSRRERIVREHEGTGPPRLIGGDDQPIP
jgi:hypothetical protein